MLKLAIELGQWSKWNREKMNGSLSTCLNVICMYLHILHVNGDKVKYRSTVNDEPNWDLFFFCLFFLKAKLLAQNLL